MEELLELSTDTVFDAAQQSQLAEVAHKTNVITIALMLMVVTVNIAAIILLVVFHKQTRRPRELGERFKDYQKTVGNVLTV